MKRFIFRVIGIQRTLLRYYILGGFVFVTGSISSQATLSKVEKRARELLDRAGIVFGEYQRFDEQQPQECLEGELKLIRLSKSCSLMLGARPLILGLGATEKGNLKQEHCQMETTVKLKDKSLVGENRERCGKQPLTQWKTKVQVNDSVLSYHRQVTIGKKKMKEITCRLKLIKDASH